MSWRRVSAAAAIPTAVLLVVTVVFAARASTSSGWVAVAIGLAVAPLASTLGVFVSRRPQVAVVGGLLSLLGLAVSAVVAREAWFQDLATWPDRQDWAWLVACLNEAAWWVLALVALLLLHFPDGTLPSRRWRWVPAVLIGCTALTQLDGAFETTPFRPPLADLDHPFGTLPLWFELIALVGFVAMLALGLASAASLLLRYRRSGHLQRAQIRWLAVAGLAVPAYPLLCLVEIALWGRPLWISAAVGLAGLVALPLATGVAVLRHDLYDVDKALSGTITWGLLTALLAAVYVAIAAATGALVGRESSLAGALGAAVCALALVPGRRRLQRVVDARVYPLRRSAVEALETLQREVSAGRAQPEELESVLRGALRDPGLRVGYRTPGAADDVDSAQLTVPTAHGVPVVLGGNRIGVIVPTSGDASSDLLRDVARRSTTLVEVSVLRLGLRSALSEVEASRTRLVQAGYEERRRLERDLHDGAQQRLVSLGMALRLAQRHLDDGTVDVDGLLDQGVAELGTAVAELRQIAHGLRPSTLDDGLPAALARLVMSVPVSVEMDIDPAPLPDDVATTAYFVVSEAIANAVKHAEARRIMLCVQRLDGHVVVRVSDDGCGGATIGSSSGLADRVAALGGSLRVASPDGAGTTVEAALPCAS